MAIDLVAFRQGYPEFVSTDDGLCTDRLALAELMNDQGAYGSEALYEAAVYCHAAGLVLESVYGSQMGQSEVPQGPNKYMRVYREQFLPRIRRRMQITGGGLP